MLVCLNVESETYYGPKKNHVFNLRVYFRFFLFICSNTVTCSGYPGCCRRTMDISFSDLGWTWMVAPRRLTTSVCIGSCRAPSMTFESFMVNLMQGHGRPSSRDERRCRPSRTDHFDALVINEDGDIQMMRLPDFIVRECACAENQRETKVPPAAPTYEGKHV